MSYSVQSPRFYHGPFAQFGAHAPTTFGAASYTAIARGPTWYPHKSDYDVVNDEAFVAQMAHEGECVLHFPQDTDTGHLVTNLDRCWAVQAILERLPEVTVFDAKPGIQNRDPYFGVRLADFTWVWDPIDSPDPDVAAHANGTSNNIAAHASGPSISGPLTTHQHYPRRDPAAPVQGDLFWARQMLWRVTNVEQDEQYHARLDIVRFHDLDLDAEAQLHAAISSPQDM